MQNAELIETEAGVVQIRMLGHLSASMERRRRMQQQVTRIFMSALTEEARKLLVRWSVDEDKLRLIVLMSQRALVEYVVNAACAVQAETKDSREEARLRLVIGVARGFIRETRTEDSILPTGDALMEAASAIRHPWALTPGQILLSSGLRASLESAGYRGVANLEALPPSDPGGEVWNLTARGAGVPLTDLVSPDLPEDVPTIGLSMADYQSTFLQRDLARFDLHSGQPRPGEGLPLIFAASFGREDQRGLALKRVNLSVDAPSYAYEIRGFGGREPLAAAQVGLSFCGDFLKPEWTLDADEEGTLADRRTVAEDPPLATIPDAAEGDVITASLTCYPLDFKWRDDAADDEVASNEEDAIEALKARILKHLDVREVCEPDRNGEIVLGRVKTTVERRDGGGRK